MRKTFLFYLLFSGIFMTAAFAAPVQDKKVKGKPAKKKTAAFASYGMPGRDSHSGSSAVQDSAYGMPSNTEGYPTEASNSNYGMPGRSSGTNRENNSTASSDSSYGMPDREPKPSPSPDNSYGTPSR